MSWATPRTWTDGELVTRGIFNAHVRDQFKYLKGDGEVIVVEDDLYHNGIPRISLCPFQINYWNGSAAEDMVKVTRDGANDHHLWIKYGGVWKEVFCDTNWTGGHIHEQTSDTSTTAEVELTTSWQSASGLSVTCPTAGQWLLLGNALIDHDYVGGDGVVEAAIYNSTDATYGQSSFLYGGGQNVEMSVPVLHTEAIAASKAYTIRAKLQSGGAGTSYLRGLSDVSSLSAVFLGAAP